jgi:hypothetical protein
MNIEKIFTDNRDVFGPEIGSFNIPAVYNFEERYIKPAAAANAMGDDFTNVLIRVEESAFRVGFNAAVRFLMDCMRGGNGQ